MVLSARATHRHALGLEPDYEETELESDQMNPTDGEAVPRIMTATRTKVFTIPVVHPWGCLAIRGHIFVLNFFYQCDP